MHLQGINHVGGRRKVVLDATSKSSYVSLDSDCLVATVAYASYWQGVRSTIGVSAGKWYWEVVPVVAPPSGGQGYAPGVCNASCTFLSKTLSGDSQNNWVTEWFSAAGYLYGPSNTGTAYATGTTTAGTVIGHALDMDAGTLTYYNNGVSKGVAFTGITGTIYPMLFMAWSSAYQAKFNFGANGFSYTPPAGFGALVL